MVGDAPVNGLMAPLEPKMALGVSEMLPEGDTPVLDPLMLLWCKKGSERTRRQLPELSGGLKWLALAGPMSVLDRRLP